MNPGKGDSENLPLISVVLPVYNGAVFIDAALESIKRQNGSWELLVVDDGSTDGTAEAVAAQAASDGRIRLVGADRMGVTAARLKGAELARGEYLFFMDADDTLPTGVLERMGAVISENGNVDLIIGDIEHIGLNGEHSVQTYAEGVVDGVGLFDWIVTHRTGFLWGKAIRKSLFLKLPVVPYGLKFCEDYVQMLQLAVSAARVQHIGMASYEYRQQPESACNRRKSRLEYAMQFYNLSEVLQQLLDLDEYFDLRQQLRLKVMFIYYLRLYLAVNGRWGEDKAKLRKPFFKYLTDGELMLDPNFDKRRRLQCRLIAAAAWPVSKLYGHTLRKQGRIY